MAISFSVAFVTPEWSLALGAVQDGLEYFRRERLARVLVVPVLNLLEGVHFVWPFFWWVGGGAERERERPRQAFDSILLVSGACLEFVHWHSYCFERHVIVQWHCGDHWLIGCSEFELEVSGIFAKRACGIC